MSLCTTSQTGSRFIKVEFVKQKVDSYLLLHHHFHSTHYTAIRPVTKVKKETDIRSPTTSTRTVSCICQEEKICRHPLGKGGLLSQTEGRSTDLSITRSESVDTPVSTDRQKFYVVQGHQTLSNLFSEECFFSNRLSTRRVFLIQSERGGEDEYFSRRVHPSWKIVYYWNGDP